MTETYGGQDNRPAFSVRHYWHILLKWKWSALLLVLAVAGGTAVFAILTPKTYTSTGSIWVEEQTNILPFEDIQRTDSTSSSPQSYSRLLQSRALAAKVIEKLKLYENPSFVGKPKRGEKPPDPKDPAFRELLNLIFLDRVSVRPVERTRLLEVSYTDRDPRRAAETLNTLFDEYTSMIVNQRYEASQRATEFLKGQISALRAEVEASERKLSDYGSAKDILPLTASETPIVTQLSEVNKAVTDATIDRVNKFDYYNQLKAGNMPDVSGSPQSGTVQRLRDQYASLSQDYARRLGTVRPEYPEMQRLKSEIDSVKEALQTEEKKLIDIAYADYQAALSKEQSYRGLLEQLRTQAFKANSNSVVYSSLRIELENKKALLESLSKRQSEADVSSRLKSYEAANIWVVDRASLPLRPTSPDRRRILLMGILAGLAGGLGLALGIEYLNNTVKTSKEVTTATGYPTLGVIPAFEAEVHPKGPLGEFKRLAGVLRGKSRPAKERSPGRKIDLSAFVENATGQNPSAIGSRAHAAVIELIAAREPNSIQAESYRSIRTTLIVSMPAGKLKTLLVTSPLAKEGKTATVANLGITLSQANKRVVILDADLRKPKQSRVFGLNSGSGLTRYVSSYVEAPDLARPTPFPNLYLIGSGPVPVNPIELLTSDRMDALIAYLKRSYDYILVDSPPLLAVSDALAMGPIVDAVVLVARGGQTPVPALKQAKQKLETHKLSCLGVILNGVNLVEQDGYYAKQYYQYSKSE